MMRLLVDPTAMLLLAAVLLVAVASLPAIGAANGRWAPSRVLIPALAMLGTMLLVGRVLSSPQLLPNVATSGIVRRAADELEHATEPNVVVVDGGSYVDGAVDGAVLERELAELGYRARVVRISAKAVNHFERHQMQEAVVSRLSTGPRPKQHWLYLAEVQLGYDVSPIAQFERNQDTLRAYHYMTPENAWYAARALLSPGSEASVEDWKWPLLRHAMINGSNVGALHRFAPAEDRKPLEDVVTTTASRRFTFPGMRAVRRAARSPLPTRDVPRWLFDIREPRTLRLWRRFEPTLVYFGVPTTDPSQMEHIRSFCRATKQPHCLAPTDKRLLRALDQKRVWLNATHLNARGARPFTQWLAKALVATGTLRR